MDILVSLAILNDGGNNKRERITDKKKTKVIYRNSPSSGGRPS